MELRHLEHFLAVAEEQSFTRAARSVHLVQSALSVSIKALERELGAALFERTTHRVELTEAGQALVPEARRTLAAAAAARDAVDAVAGGVRGTVRIGIMQAVTLIDLAGLLTRFHRQRGEVQLVPRASQGGSKELARQVASGELDLALVSLAESASPGVSLTRLAAEPLLLACSPGHRLAARRTVRLDELDGADFVEVPEGWGTRMRVEQAFAQHGMRRGVSVEVTDLATLVELVRADFGLGFLPRSALNAAGRVRMLKVRPELTWEVCLAVPTERRPTAASAALIEMILAEYPADR
ncbi:MAG TPA: LysR family transcriptional regulator [Actinospica sp.]|nr:LysR family transcriptional regulator [Actinospica sp.]